MSTDVYTDLVKSLVEVIKLHSEKKLQDDFSRGSPLYQLRQSFVDYACEIAELVREANSTADIMMETINNQASSRENNAQSSINESSISLDLPDSIFDNFDNVGNTGNVGEVGKDNKFNDDDTFDSDDKFDNFDIGNSTNTNNELQPHHNTLEDHPLFKMVSKSLETAVVTRLTAESEPDPDNDTQKWEEVYRQKYGRWNN